METINMQKLQVLLRGAGELFKDRSAARHTRTKGVADYVTEVDYEVQRCIREQLAVDYPHIQFLSEEKTNDEIDRSGLVWVLDPVDGTTNLIHDYKTSVISLALMQEGRVTLGMVYNPYSGELVYAQEGKGCFCGEEQVFVSRAAAMDECLIAIGTSPYQKELAKDNFKLFEKVFMDSQDIRRSGSAAFDLAGVACGRLDGFFERNLKIWDYAAGMLLVKEAGGCVLDFAGRKAQAGMSGDIVAANPEIAKMLAAKYLAP